MNKRFEGKIVDFEIGIVWTKRKNLAGNDKIMGLKKTLLNEIKIRLLNILAVCKDKENICLYLLCVFSCIELPCFILCPLTFC